MIRLKCNSFDTDIGIQMMQSKKEAKQNRNFVFIFLSSYHTFFHSHCVHLEQITTHYDCFEKVSALLLSTNTNQKGGTLDKSLFFLGLGHIPVQPNPPTATCSSDLVELVSLIGCHQTTLVLISVHWHKSEGKTRQKLKVSVSFDMLGRNIKCDFIYFCDLEQFAAEFLATEILFS